MAWEYVADARQGILQLHFQFKKVGQRHVKAMVARLTCGRYTIESSGVLPGAGIRAVQSAQQQLAHLLDVVPMIGRWAGWALHKAWRVDGYVLGCVAVTTYAGRGQR